MDLTDSAQTASLGRLFREELPLGTKNSYMHLNLSKDDSLEFSNMKAELYLGEVYELSC